MPALHRVIFTLALGHPLSHSPDNQQSHRVPKLKESGIFFSMPIKGAEVSSVPWLDAGFGL